MIVGYVLSKSTS